MGIRNSVSWATFIYKPEKPSLLSELYVPSFNSYEKRKTEKKNQFTYHFVGYTSLYAFLHWPDKTRLRLA